MKNTEITYGSSANGNGFSGDYNDLTNKPVIPSTTEDLPDSEDNRYVTDEQKNNIHDHEAQDNAIASKVTLAEVKADTDIADAINKKHNEVYTHDGSSLGYAINVQALTSSPVDAQTVYFGMLPKAPITTANVSRCYIPQSGTIKVARVWCYSGTAGTAEAWSLYIRLNNATDYLIATLSVATNARDFSNTNLNIPVVVGDYIEIKGVQPTWVTNPLTCIYGGYIYVC